MKIKISKYVEGKIREFAEKRISGSKGLYNYRGPSSDSKMIDDIVIGTAGEYAVYNLLREQGRKCSKPDLKIYKARRKSFDQDLLSEGVKIHVKSQSLESEKKYGKSFLFQRSDKLISTPEANEFLAFTNVNLSTMEVEVLGFVNAKTMVELDLIGECKVPWFQKTKVAIYLEDFGNYGIVLDSLGGVE